MLKTLVNILFYSVLLPVSVSFFLPVVLKTCGSIFGHVRKEEDSIKNMMRFFKRGDLSSEHSFDLLLSALARYDVRFNVAEYIFSSA